MSHTESKIENAPSKESIKAQAGQCRHYAMCKIDFLGRGLCPSGKKKAYVSYFPQGRMDIYYYLDELPLTDRLVDIAESCPLCGICEFNCYFVNELPILDVMRALNEAVEERMKHESVIVEKNNPLTEALQEFCGAEWASNDPAILLSYATDPSPFLDRVVPQSVVLPGSHEEVQQIMAYADRNDTPVAIRGNGSSVMGLVLGEGIVIDTVRLRKLQYNEDEASLTVGAGISSFEAQQEAARHGFRIAAAEPAALTIANINCSGMFSTLSAQYGIGASHYFKARWVDQKGGDFTISPEQPDSLFPFHNHENPSRGLCTEIQLRLHPKADQENALIIPLASPQQGLEAVRRMGEQNASTSIALLSNEYLADFVSLSLESSLSTKDLLRDRLGIAVSLLITAPTSVIEQLKQNFPVQIPADLFPALVRKLPALKAGAIRELTDPFGAEDRLFEVLFHADSRPLLESILDDAEDRLLEKVPERLRETFTDIYRQTRFTDLVWLTDFRILSSRMGREKHILAIIFYLPFESDTITTINTELASIAENEHIKHDFGFVTPLNQGTHAVLEYDFYINHRDPEEQEKGRRALIALQEYVMKLETANPRINWIGHVLNQGFCSQNDVLKNNQAEREH